MIRSYGMSGVYGAYGSNSIYGNLSNYSSISRSAYSKLAKASSSVASKSNGNGLYADAIAKINGTKLNSRSEAVISAGKEAQGLYESANKLTNTGRGNMFTNAASYDKNAAYDAVNSFVEDYNSTVDSIKNTYNTTIRNTGDGMKRMAGIMKNSLSNVGITVGDDGKLSLNEETFKNADFSRVKSLFNGGSSFAGIVSTSASRIASQSTVNAQAYNTGLYASSLLGSAGLYGYGSNGLYRSLGSYGSYGGLGGIYGSLLSGQYFNGLF